MNKDDDPKHWKLGIFYYNKDNPAESAPKRNGIGTTPNFASKRGRHMLALIFVPAVIVIIICVLIAFFSRE